MIPFNSSNSRKRQALRRMQLLATSCVGAALALRIGATFLGDEVWVGYLKAFTEASVIGGLADWFAISALFRHPLGLPIPHTRILPRSKLRLANSLADFVTENFLTRESIQTEIKKIDIAELISTFLEEREEQISKRIVGFIPRFIETLDDTSIRTFLTERVSTKLRELDVAPLAGRALELISSGNKGEQVVTDILHVVSDSLEENRDLLMDLVRKELPLPDQMGIPGIAIGIPFSAIKDKLSRLISEAVVKKLLDVLTEVKEERDHEIRERIREKISELAARLKEDEELKEKVLSWRDELLENQNISEYTAGIWRETKEIVRSDIANPQGAIHRQLVHVLKSFRKRIKSDAKFRAKLNRGTRPFLIDTICGAAPACGRVIRETVGRWDAEELTQKLELEVGKDLQFVRLNGTVVGGILGIVLHFILSFFA